MKQDLKQRIMKVITKTYRNDQDRNKTAILGNALIDNNDIVIDMVKQDYDRDSTDSFKSLFDHQPYCTQQNYQDT